ncbi:MAG: rhomboid family intramembrane serine protease [Pseudomonadota bacterium]
MLLIPITGKSSWKNPPFITIGLIVINILIYILLQSNDGELRYEAEKFYFESGLAKIEITRYLRFSGKPETKNPDRGSGSPLSDEALIRLRMEMTDNAAFLKKLCNDEIIAPSDPDYPQWKELRKSYEQKLSGIVTHHYGFKPTLPNTLTLFTHMFLHGSMSHLIGNMIFLWLSGCLLEMGIGRLAFCVNYLLTGLFSVGLFWLCYPNVPGPLIGASGAISGLMGAVSVLYGRKKIKVFYSLGFYFNYVKAPALLLLPLWIGNECYQLIFNSDSNVAYVAHLGGLFSGATFSWINLKLIGAVNWKTVAEEPEDIASPLIEKALDAIGKLNWEEGGQLLEKAIAANPSNIVAMTHLFNARKIIPKDPRFQTVSQQLLTALAGSNENAKKAADVYCEYKQLTPSPALSPELSLKLSTILTTLGQMDKAENLLARLLKTAPDHPGLPTALLKLARGYQKSGATDNFRKCMKILHVKYPNSAEARIAGRALSPSQ